MPLPLIAQLLDLRERPPRRRRRLQLRLIPRDCLLRRLKGHRHISADAQSHFRRTGRQPFRRAATLHPSARRTPFLRAARRSAPPPPAIFRPPAALDRRRARSRTSRSRRRAFRFAAADRRENRRNANPPRADSPPPDGSHNAAAIPPVGHRAPGKTAPAAAHRGPATGTAARARSSSGAPASPPRPASPLRVRTAILISLPARQPGEGLFQQSAAIRPPLLVDAKSEPERELPHPAKGHAPAKRQRRIRPHRHPRDLHRRQALVRLSRGIDKRFFQFLQIQRAIALRIGAVILRRKDAHRRRGDSQRPRHFARRLRHVAGHSSEKSATASAAVTPPLRATRKRTSISSAARLSVFQQPHSVAFPSPTSIASSSDIGISLAICATPRIIPAACHTQPCGPLGSTEAVV